MVQRYVYTPYGVATVLDANWNATTDQFAWQYMHQGGRQDPITGLYDFRHRDYSPTLGNWVEQDPAGYVNGANGYQFVLSSPASGVDSAGLWSAKGLLRAYAKHYGRKDMQALLVLLAAGLRIRGKATKWDDWYMQGRRTIVIATDTCWVMNKSNSNAASQLNEALATHFELGDTDWLHKAGMAAIGGLKVAGGVAGAATGAAMADTGLGAIVGIPLMLLSGSTAADGAAQIGGQVVGAIQGHPNAVGENGFNPGRWLAGEAGYMLWGRAGERYAKAGYSIVDLTASVAGGVYSLDKLLSSDPYAVTGVYKDLEYAGPGMMPKLQEATLVSKWKLILAGNSISATSAAQSAYSDLKSLGK